MLVGVGLGQADVEGQRKSWQRPKRSQGESRFSEVRANPFEYIHLPLSSFSTRSGVLASPKACSHSGARYITVGAAKVGLSMVLKKKRCPSPGCTSFVKASSVHSLRVCAIAFVWAKTAMDSAEVWKSASCWPVNRYVTRPVTFCFQSVSTGKYR